MKKPEAVPIDVVRFPLARGGSPARLDVPTLTAVLGAAVVLGPRDDKDTGFDVKVSRAAKILVLVDDAPVLDARIADVLGRPGMATPYRSTKEQPDLLILTPRESGVEVVIDTENARLPGAEVHLYVAR